MIKAGRVLTALALAALLAPPAMAAKMTAEERAMLRDSAKAREVVGARVEHARAAATNFTAASAVNARGERAQAKAELASRKIERELAKAEAALADGSFKAASDLAARVERLAAAKSTDKGTGGVRQ